MVTLRNLAFLSMGLLVVVVFGCGSDPEAKKTNTITAAGAAQGQEEKINEALAKAGQNKLSAVLDDPDENYWIVTITPDGVGPKGEPPPGRPIPKRARVKKSDFSVQVLEDPNKGRGGKTGNREIE